MLKMCTKTKTMQALRSTTLTQQSLLERYDLQRAIVNGWKSFCDELGLGELFFIGQEVNPHESCNDSIDILALDWEGTPVIIELKREKNKLQLLQSLSYAAMLSTWTTEDYLKFLSRINHPQRDEIAPILEGADVSTPRIVLVAENYDPEVILTADFLQDRGIDVTAMAIKLAMLDDNLLVSLILRYPLAELSESYTPRRRVLKSDDDDISWENVLTKITYPWAAKAVNMFRQKMEGSPKRRGFGSVYKNTPIGTVESIHFRSDNIFVTLYGRTSEAAETLKEVMQLPVEPWGRDGEKSSGWGIRLRSEEDLDRFLRAVGSI